MRLFKIIGIIELIVIIPVLINVSLASTAQIEDKQYQAAVVFGASVINNSVPSKVLQLRLDRAIELYNQDIVNLIIVSGDRRENNYDEPEVMQQYLINNSIPISSIRKDVSGENTLKTCKSVKNDFNLSEIIVVTQDFHIPRAYALCTLTGLNVAIAPAESSSRPVTVIGTIREYPSLMFNLLVVLTE